MFNDLLLETKRFFRLGPLFLAIFGCLLSSAFAQEPVGGDWGEGLSSIGRIEARDAREIASSNWSIGAETMDRDYTIYANWRDYLGPLGAKKARIQSGWAKTEKRQGEYDWAWLDEIIPDMVRQGVEPWVCLCYGNPIYPGGGTTGLGGGMPTSEEAFAGWDRFVRAFVRRYQEHVDEWEVWNEPGLRGANPDDAYARLLIRTAKIIRSEQPDSRITGLATAGIKHSWTKKVLDRLKEAESLDLIDEISYHPYSYNPDDSYPAVMKLRRLVRSYGDHLTLRQGENGCPSKRGSFGALSNNDWNETSQAKWALRRLLGDLGRGIPSSYFAICDMQYPSRRNYKGLLAIDDQKRVEHPKRGYYAVQHLTALFDDSLERCEEVEVNIQSGSDASYAAFVYKNPQGEGVIPIWRSSDRPGKKPAVENIEVVFSDISFEEPVLVDLLSGHVFSLEASRWKKNEDGMTFSSLPVYDSPVVLAEWNWVEDRCIDAE